MNDLLFFPLALAMALAIIASAALPGRDRLECGSVSGAGTNYSSVIVAGNDLCRMNAAGQATLDLLKTDDTITAIRISSGAGLLGDRPDRNPHLRLAADLETQFAGYEVRVTITAKPSGDGGATAFQANYSVGPAGSSGWQTFRMVPDYQDYSFTWQLPRRTQGENAVDYLAIRPVVPEKVRSVEISSVRFDRLRRVPGR
jgi:hypothetical protein